MKTIDDDSDCAFWVGEHYVQPVLNRMTDGGEEVSVEPRVMAVLTYLAQHAGHVVSRDELLDSVWADLVVNEDALTRAVSEVRKLFGDDPRAPAVIETIRGRGYRLIAPVRLDSASLHEVTISGDGAFGGDSAPDLSPPEAAPLPQQNIQTKKPAGAVFAALLVAGIAVVSVFALWQAGAGESVSAEFSPATPFTTYPGREIEPAVSPEGARVAFAWDGGEGEGFDLYVKQSGRESPLRLTDDPAREGSPTWSPDGSTIAFARAGDAPGLYTVSSLGGLARRVHTTSSYVQSLDWSPDGGALAFSQAVEGTPAQLWSLDLASGETRALTEPAPERSRDLSPRFSPDGRRLVFVRAGLVGRRDLIVLSLDDGAERLVAENQLGIRGLDWLDDGTLVVASYRSGTFGLWRIDVASGAQTWIPATGEWSYSPSVAAQTGAVVYQDLRFKKDVWQIRLDGPGGTVLGTEPVVVSTWYDCEARVSPSGDRLAFSSSRSGHFEVWVSAVDGDDPIQLTDFDGAFVGNPRWSPDGRSIAFSGSPDGASSVYVINAEGGRPKRLTPPGWNALLTGWTSTGQGVYFSSDHSGSWQLWRADLAGGKATQVTTQGALFAAESADGGSLYVVRPDRPGLWHIAMADGRTMGEAELVIEDLPVGNARDVVLHETGVYYLQRQENGVVVAFYDFSTSQSRVVADVVRIANPSLAASSDGATLFYGRVEGAESDVYLLAPSL